MRLAARRTGKLIQQRPLPGDILPGDIPGGFYYMTIDRDQSGTGVGPGDIGVGDVQNGTSFCSGRFGIGVISPVS